MGKGAIDYAAGSLEARGYARLLDTLFTEAGVSPPPACPNFARGRQPRAIA
ncbi:MAG: hypothetical protein AAB225_16025 [Acidobacteriota bacterium]